MSTATIYRRRFFSELKRSLRGCRLRLQLNLSLFDEGFSLDLFGFFIPLLFLDRWAREPREMMESWGFTFFERTIQLNWGDRCKVVHLPWEFEHLKHEVRRPDGPWVPYVGSYESKEPDGRWQQTYPYRYVLKSGEVQERQASIHVERREWRWRWLMWCPWPAIRRQSIDVVFDAEVGERTSSWKGGTVGCGYEMLPGEVEPRETLWRMELERVFN
jgi:hypothetical protein